MIKAVVFDMGGVLVWDLWEHLFLGRDGLAERYGLDKDYAKRIAEELWQEFAYRPTDEVSWQQLEQQYWNQVKELLHLPSGSDELIELSQGFVRPVDGMQNLLKQLQSSGIELAICSNNTEFWFQRQIRVLELDQFFPPEKIVLSCRIGAAKKSDDLEMFRAVSKVISCDVRECVLVDDRSENIDQALKCEIASILFPSHKHYGAYYLRHLFTHLGLLD